MRIPLTYNLRNLVVRRTTTVMTALGIGLSVAVLAASLGLSAGIDRAFQGSGHPLQILVLRKGSGGELSSQITRESFNEVIRYRAGVAKLPNGEPAASPELVNTVNLATGDNPDDVKLLSVRGVTPIGIAIREDCRLTAGRWFEFGKREIVVGSDIARRFEQGRVGKKIRFGLGEWEIVGVFHSEYPARNSELMGDANQMLAEFRRGSVFSSVLVRAQDEVSKQALINELTAERRLQPDVISEKEYYAKQSSSGDLIKYVGSFVAIIMAVGSVFAAMNTMYAAVARRSREIGTLRVLGFSRSSILLSFCLESMLLAVIGGVAGLLLVLPLSGFTTGIGSNVAFSEVAFRLSLTPRVAMAGMIFALVIGVMGGLLPASNAARKQILRALREV